MILRFLTKWDVDGLTLSRVNPKKIVPYRLQTTDISDAENKVGKLAVREAPPGSDTAYVSSWIISNFLRTEYVGSIAYY